MAGKVSSARRGVTIVHGGKPRPMSSAQLRFLRGRVMRYACADVLLERLEREGLISDDERKQLASDVVAACRLASGSIFRGVDVYKRQGVSISLRCIPTNSAVRSPPKP